MHEREKIYDKYGPLNELTYGLMFSAASICVSKHGAYVAQQQFTSCKHALIVVCARCRTAGLAQAGHLFFQSHSVSAVDTISLRGMLYMRICFTDKALQVIRVSGSK